MSGLSRKVVILVAASSCAIGVGYGVGWAASEPSHSTTDAPTVTSQVLDEKQQSLADQLERDNASGLHPVGDGQGNVAGWVSTETFRAGPAANLAEVGEVYDDEGTVVGYYDTQAGFITIEEHDSGTYDLAMAQAAMNAPPLLPEEIDAIASGN